MLFILDRNHILYENINLVLFCNFRLIFYIFEFDIYVFFALIGIMHFIPTLSVFIHSELEDIALRNTVF